MATQPDILQDEIARRTGQGWVLVSRDAAEAQMRKPKRFSILWFLAWTILSVGTLFWVYLVWHWAKRDQLIFLRMVEGQVVATGTRSLWGTLFAPAGAWWRWAGERESTQGKVLAYGGPVAAIVILIIIIAVAASGGGGGDDGEELVSGQPTDAVDTDDPEAEDTPEPTWETAPVTEETVRAALDDLDNLGLIREDIDADNVSLLSVIPDADGAGFIITIEFKPGDVLSETDFLTVAGASTLITMARLFDNPGVDGVKMSAMADLTDALGNESTDFLTTATINRATADEINWPGFSDRQLLDNKHIFCFADAFIIKALIYNQLEDKGCLPGPSR